MLQTNTHVDPGNTVLPFVIDTFHRMKNIMMKGESEGEIVIEENEGERDDDLNRQKEKVFT